MTPAGIAGDAILAAAVATIAALELRRRRRRNMHRKLHRAYRPRDRGQAIVEMALVLAVFLPLMLAASQVALLLAYRLAQQQANGTLAGVAAQNGPGASFDAALASESTRLDCESPRAVLSTPQPVVVVVVLACTWRAPVYADAAWPVTTSASAVLYASPAPSASPSADPSASVGP